MRVLVIRYSSLGDVVLAGAVPRAVARRYPDAEIDFLTKPAYATVVSHFDARTNVLPLDAANPLGSSLAAVRGKRYDWIIDLHGTLRSHIVARLTRGSHRVCVDKQSRRRWRMVSHKAGLDRPISALSGYCKAVAALGVEGGNCVPRLILDEGQAGAALALKSALPQAIGIGWGARWPTKAIPDAILTRIVEALTAHGPVNIRLLGLRVDEGAMRSFAAQATEQNDRVRCVVHVDLDLPSLMSHLTACAVYLGPDSGLLHMATALQVPSVAIFGPTHPALGFAPIGPAARIFHAGTDCSPCHKHGAAPCFRDRLYCFEELDTRAIAETMRELQTHRDER